MEFDPNDVIRSLGGAEAVAQMDHEARADALEDYQTQRLNAAAAARASGKTLPTVANYEELVDQRGYRRGVGRLFVVNYDSKVANPDVSGLNVSRLPKMPEKPTLVDFFKYRFDPGHISAHLLQSAKLAKDKGASEEIVLACLLHDAAQVLMKADHGYWGAQLIEPYVSERVAFAIRYHQALRFFPDPSIGYEYPKSYFQTFGVDYEPLPHVVSDYKYARDHRWYMDARLVTVNDFYAFDPNVEVSIDEFEDIIGRNFKQPKEGLGYDRSPVSHMWRTIIHPDQPL
jgi:hypothetical protein